MRIATGRSVGLSFTVQSGMVSARERDVMSDAMQRKPATPEDVWAILREVSTSQRETDRRMQETDRRMQETDRQMQETDGGCKRRTGK